MKLLDNKLSVTLIFEWLSIYPSVYLSVFMFIYICLPNFSPIGKFIEQFGKSKPEFYGKLKKIIDR